MTGIRAVFVAAILSLSAAVSMQAQSPAKSVANGVFSEIQATRGAAAYDNACAGCHRADLGGADGPALKEDRFNRMFAGKDLRALYTRMATTMPRGAPGSLGEGVYLDILAHLLRENGFPAGNDELRADRIDGVEVLPTQEKPLPAPGDFAYVQVSGCWTRGNDGEWWLNGASDPVAVRPPDELAKRQTVAGSGSVPLLSGTQVYRLLDAPAYDPASKVGRKFVVTGLLIRLPGEQRITISDLRDLEESCRP